MSSYYFLPTRNVFGEGAVNDAGALMKSLNVAKAMIVTDAFLAKSGMADNIKKIIEDAGLTAEIFGGAEPNPTDKNVEAGVAFFKETGCDSIISLGGGSSYDCAKAIGLVASNGGKIHDYEGIDKAKIDVVPMLAINTTAGTASEITRFCIITDTGRKVKMAIVDWRVTPKVAINDPALMVGMPPSLTAATGMDAMTHAIEAYVSSGANVLTDSAALMAVKMIYQYLPKAVANGDYMKARDKMAYRDDMDLEFLAKATHEELEYIVNLLVYDPKDGKKRYTEELSKKLRNCTDYHAVWKDIAGELQCFGANTLSTALRMGKGVTYKEILCDCCKALKINFRKESNVADIEQEYLKNVLKNAWEKMDEKQRKEFLQSANSVARSQKLDEVTNISGLLGLISISGYIGFLLGRTLLFGGPIVYSAIALPALTASGSLLTGALGQTAGRAASLATPLGWALNAYTLYQISGPAFRVTIPACFIIAHLRKKYELSAKDLAQLNKYDALAKLLYEKVSSQEELEKKYLICYVFGQILVGMSNNTIGTETLDFVLFGILQEDVKFRIMQHYAGLPKLNSLREVKEYAVKECSCTVELLAAIKDYLLIDAPEEIKQKIEKEF